MQNYRRPFYFDLLERNGNTFSFSLEDATEFT